ncbi:MAG: cytochrome c, partial [Xanthobacteraceae bacterium]
KTYGKFGYATLNRMARDQMPYDQAKVDEALAHFAETAAKIPSLFPAGGFQGPVEGSSYYATQKAFESQSDIQARAEKFAKSVADAKGTVKDLGSLKAVWPGINDNHCSSCHEPYRARKS